jgi:hypothetical protein
MLPLHIAWQAEPDDAIRLAALRWFALELERLSIEIYATDKNRFAEVEKLFRSTLSRLADTRNEIAASIDEDDECPEGYIRCKDGFCAPACDGIISESNRD